MSALNIQQLTYQAPAQNIKDVQKMLSSSAAGQNLQALYAYPKRNYPTAENLGLQDFLDPNAVFPYKSNSVGLTDIEVPTTILVLAGPEMNKIKFQTNKFILQSLVKPLPEKVQIIETFGDPSIYFYGNRTRLYTMQGILFDAEDPTQLNNVGGTAAEDALKSANYWATAFQDFYDNALRGTVLKQNKQIAAMYVNQWYIKGYPINLTIGKESGGIPQTATFQMTWAIVSETLLSSKQAQTLWSNSRVSKETVNALNTYLGAVDKYNAAYNDLVNKLSVSSQETITALYSKLSAAEAEVNKAFLQVEIAMAKDSSTLNNNKVRK